MDNLDLSCSSDGKGKCFGINLLLGIFRILSMYVLLSTQLFLLQIEKVNYVSSLNICIASVVDYQYWVYKIR